MIQSGTERSVIRSRICAELILVDIWVVEIIVVRILLLAPDTPSSVSQASEKQSTTNTTDHTTNSRFGCVTESRAATAAATACQGSRVDAGGLCYNTAAGASDMNSASSANACNCSSNGFGGTGCDECFRSRDCAGSNSRY